MAANSPIPPNVCLLCNARNTINPAQFHQVYYQKSALPVLLDWWECSTCRGWFVYPVPSPEVIERYWGTVIYADPKYEEEIARGKRTLAAHVLGKLKHWQEPGPLLDFGCNFGQFLLAAQKAGWSPSGYEPYEAAAKAARAKGFDVRSSWSLEEAGFAEGSFAAITVIDTFCYTWDPFETLQTLRRLLKPGGILAMRLTNKRLVLGLARALTAAGPARDTRISLLLQGQFHSIASTALGRIMREVGFDRIQINTSATTAPWSALRWRTRTAYLAATLVYGVSLRQINLSPGILFFAKKAIDESWGVRTRAHAGKDHPRP